MDYKIDWKLYSDNKLLVANTDVIAFYDKNILKYIKEDEKNKIDINQKIFHRITNDYNMTIDFNKKECSFLFEEIGKCKFDINCDFKIKNNEIILTYKIDESVQKIIVNLKEEIK